jgi:hypothetical protein
MDKCSKCGIYQLSCPHCNKNVFHKLEYSPPKYLLTIFNPLGVTTQSQHLHYA